MLSAPMMQASGRLSAEQYADLVACAPRSPAALDRLVAEHEVEFVWNADRACNDQQRALFREVSHRAVGAGAEMARGNLGPLQDPPTSSIAALLIAVHPQEMRAANYPKLKGRV